MIVTDKGNTLLYALLKIVRDSLKLTPATMFSEQNICHFQCIELITVLSIVYRDNYIVHNWKELLLLQCV